MLRRTPELTATVQPESRLSSWANAFAEKTADAAALDYTTLGGMRAMLGLAQFVNRQASG